jgi:hypothetical protein
MTKNIPRLQITPLLGSCAPHSAPPSVRTFPSAANIHQTHVQSGLVVCRQHTQSTRNPNRKHSSNPMYLPPATIYARSICPRPLTPPPHLHAGAPAGSPGACVACGPLQPHKPTRGPPASPVPHCTATARNCTEPGHRYGPLPYSSWTPNIPCPRGPSVNHGHWIGRRLLYPYDRLIPYHMPVLNHPLPPCSLLDTRCLPPGINSLLELGTLGLLGCPPMAARKP